MGFQDLIQWVMFNLGSFGMGYKHHWNGLSRINLGSRDGV
jgi:hypothetical protein